MSNTIYGLPQKFVSDYLMQIEANKQNHFLIEACADLIEAVSKYDRTLDDRDEIIEEMGHTILSCAVVSRQLDIREKDILDVITKLGAKKGVILQRPVVISSVERDFNGMTLKFDLSLQEQEDIYRNRRLIYQLNDAERHLREIIFEDIADDEHADDVCIDTYGCTVDEMCDPNSEHHALYYLVNRFNDLADEDTAINDTWRIIIREMLAQYKTGHMEADAIAAGAGGASFIDQKVESEAEANMRRQLIALIEEDLSTDASETLNAKYICFNTPLTIDDWVVLDTFITDELEKAANCGHGFTELNAFAGHLAKAFCKTNYAQEHSITNYVVINPDERTPFYQRTVNMDGLPAIPEADKKLIALRDTDGKAAYFMCFNQALTNDAWTQLETLMASININDIPDDTYSDALSTFGQYAIAKFIKTEWAKTNGYFNGSVFQADARAAYWSFTPVLTNQPSDAPIIPSAAALETTLPDGATRSATFTFADNIDPTHRSGFIVLVQQILDETAMINTSTTTTVSEEIMQAAAKYLPMGRDSIKTLSVHETGHIL